MPFKICYNKSIMNFVQNSLLKYFLVLSALVIFSYSIQLGLNRAKFRQQAEIIVQNTSAIQSGLEFFSMDFDRYPQVSEFEDRITMLSYFSSFPPQEFPSENCPTTFVYARTAVNSYELNFCLPARVENFQKGWNKLVQNSSVK